MKPPKREGVTSFQLRPEVLRMMRPLMKQGVSKTQIINEALKKYLIEKEFEAIREKWVPLAQAKGIHSDDDVFRILNEDRS